MSTTAKIITAIAVCTPIASLAFIMLWIDGGLGDWVRTRIVRHHIRNGRHPFDAMPSDYDAAHRRR